MYKLTVESSFAAAHQLARYRGSCEALHGHNWRVQLKVSTERLDEIGLGIDFKVLKRVLNKHLDLLDHTNLNQLPFFSDRNPSSENIARWLYEQLHRDEELKTVTLTEVSVWESEKACATYSAQ